MVCKADPAKVAVPRELDGGLMLEKSSWVVCVSRLPISTIADTPALEMTVWPPSAVTRPMEVISVFPKVEVVNSLVCREALPTNKSPLHTRRWAGELLFQKLSRTLGLKLLFRASLHALCQVVMLTIFAGLMK